MKNFATDRVRYFSVFFSLFFLMACQQKVNLSYVVDGGDIVLCLSSQPACKGDGVYKGIIMVNKVSPGGAIGKIVWSIKRENGGGEIKYIKWGEVPSGWTQAVPADELKDGEVYFIEGIYFKYSVANGFPSLVVYGQGEMNEKK